MELRFEEEVRMSVVNEIWCFLFDIWNPKYENWISSTSMQNNYSKGKEVLEAGKDLQFDQVGAYEYTTGLENIFLFLAAKSKIKISCGRHK